MKMAIYGAGAAGCALGAKLIRSQQDNLDITFIARGKHAQALKENGLAFTTKEAVYTLPLTVAQHPHEAGKQDVIVIATKAYTIPDIAPCLAPLIHEKTIIMPVCNGIPWWFLYEWNSALPNRRLRTLDPEGMITSHIPIKQVMGAVIYMAATLTGPGKVTNLADPRWLIGELTHQHTERAQALAHTFEKAGFIHALTDNIRKEIWQKLCWNIAFNPSSVITRKNSGELAKDPHTRQLAIDIMGEMQHIADALGLDVTVDIASRIAIAENAGVHKPSMLQDFEAGKPLETDAIVGAVVEISEALHVDIPHIRSIHTQIMACDRISLKPV